MRATVGMGILFLIYCSCPFVVDFRVGKETHTSGGTYWLGAVLCMAVVVLPVWAAAEVFNLGSLAGFRLRRLTVLLFFGLICFFFHWLFTFVHENWKAPLHYSGDRTATSVGYRPVSFFRGEWKPSVLALITLLELLTAVLGACFALLWLYFWRSDRRLRILQESQPSTGPPT